MASAIKCKFDDVESGENQCNGACRFSIRADGTRSSASSRGCWNTSMLTPADAMDGLSSETRLIIEAKKKSKEAAEALHSPIPSNMGQLKKLLQQSEQLVHCHTLSSNGIQNCFCADEDLCNENVTAPTI